MAKENYNDLLYSIGILHGKVDAITTPENAEASEKFKDFVTRFANESYNCGAKDGYKAGTTNGIAKGIYGSITVACIGFLAWAGYCVWKNERKKKEGI